MAGNKYNYTESTQPKMLYTLQYTNTQGDTASLTGDYKQIINHIAKQSMSYKIYNHTISSNEKVSNTIKNFRKNDNKNRKPKTLLHSKKRS